MSLNVLVMGWYGRQNAGDELMKHAIARLLKARGAQVTFVDRIDAATVEGVDGVVFGGGSILHDDPNVSTDVVDLMASAGLPVCYLGVGGETTISPVHQRLIDVSPIVVFRELDVPDLAFALGAKVPTVERRPDSLLVVPNVEVLPTCNDPHWMHVAWERYKNEVAQALDAMVSRGTQLTFLLMCSATHRDDVWATHELIGRMATRSSDFVVRRARGVVDELLSEFASHSAVLTQRYHGIIMAEMAGTPYVAVYHHDKLRMATPVRGTRLPYHGVQKHELIDGLTGALNATLDPFVVEASVYDDIADRIVGYFGRKQTW